MTQQTSWRNHLQGHKTLFTVLAVGLLLVELEIFALAAIHSGRESRLQVLNHHNDVVYDARSYKFDEREKAQFESTFGPLSDYQVKLVTEERPFPLRAWLAAAAGLPIAAMLLFGFFVKAYEALFFEGRPNSEPVQDAPTDRLSRLITRISRLNIFAIGGFVLLLVVGLFAVPHLLSEFGRYGAAAIAKYRWVVLAICAVFLGLVIWIIFLRYLLARKAIEAQAEVQKYRLQLQYFGTQAAIGHGVDPDKRPHAGPFLIDLPADDTKDRSLP